jgi:predicted  nucleic acid-binding Zn-ribbon protein
VTREEYDDRMRRLEANAEDARKSLQRAQANFDSICEEMAALRHQWRHQEQEAGQ